MNKSIKKLVISLAIISLGIISACNKNESSFSSDSSISDISSISSIVSNSDFSDISSFPSSNEEPSSSSVHIHIEGEPIKEDIVEPTCLESGSYHLKTYCKECHELLNDELVNVPALGHDLIHHDAKEATCTEIGYNAYDTCSRCDYSTYQEIAPTGHLNTETKEENRIEPTCTETGSYDLVTICNDCQKEVSRERKEIAALGHDYQFDSFVWNDDYSAKAKCICGRDNTHISYLDAEVSKEILNIPSESVPGTIKYVASYQEHNEEKVRTIALEECTYSDWVIIQETSCKQDGIEQRTCNEFPTVVEKRSIPKLEHVYEFGGFRWHTETSQYFAKAVYVCIYDSSHGLVPKEVPIKKEVVKQPTCTELGVMKYTAYYDGHTDSIEGPIDYHNYQNGVCLDCGAKQPQQGYIYKLNEDKQSYSICGYNGYERDLVFPSSYLGLPVTVIGGDNFNQTTFFKAYSDTFPTNSIVIPDTVTTIDSNIFTRGTCSHLNKVVLGKNVTTIKNNAFFECRNLVEIYNRSSLNLTIGSSENGNIAKFAKDIYTDEDYVSKLENINGYIVYHEGEDVIFLNCISHDTFLKIPNGVTSIGQYAFVIGLDIFSLKIPASVKEMDSKAIYYLKNLKEIYNLSSLVIGQGDECDVLAPSSVKAIHTSLVEESIFSTDENGFVSLNEDDAVTLYAYKGNAETVNLPNDIDILNSYAFIANPNIKHVITNEGLSVIQNEVFLYCDNLIDVTISSTVKHINYGFVGSLDYYVEKIYFADPDNWKFEPISMPVWDLSDPYEARLFFATNAAYSVFDKAE